MFNAAWSDPNSCGVTVKNIFDDSTSSSVPVLLTRVSFDFKSQSASAENRFDKTHLRFDKSMNSI